MTPGDFSFLVFFAAVFLCFGRLPSVALRQHLLAWSSVALYALWDWRFVPVLLGVTATAWLGGMAIGGARTRVRLVTTCAVGAVLLILSGFKYLGFLAGVLASLGLSADSEFRLTLIFPLGISYYSFRAISYLVDVRRGNAEVERRFHLMLLYIGFFPIIAAGPITRASAFLSQADTLDRASPQALSQAAYKFAVGFVMKAVIADALVGIAAPVLTNPGEWSQSAVWVASFACYAQLYFDFAGYSLMAIGCAAWLGFKVPPNFNWPTLAVSIGDYWRRWHMSLSSWLRDYLYIPLGGSQKGALRAYGNLSRIVFGTASIDKAGAVVTALFEANPGASNDYPLWLALAIATPLVLDGVIGPRTLGMNRAKAISPVAGALALGAMMGVALWLLPLTRAPFIYVQY
jgi:D-alanyl-lipoteichoic acid acyltransferase DltB (MBOAT superfamily)